MEEKYLDERQGGLGEGGLYRVVGLPGANVASRGHVGGSPFPHLDRVQKYPVQMCFRARDNCPIL